MSETNICLFLCVFLVFISAVKSFSCVNLNMKMKKNNNEVCFECDQPDKINISWFKGKTLDSKSKNCFKTTKEFSGLNIGVMGPVKLSVSFEGEEYIRCEDGSSTYFDHFFNATNGKEAQLSIVDIPVLSFASDIIEGNNEEYKRLEYIMEDLPYSYIELEQQEKKLRMAKILPLLLQQETIMISNIFTNNNKIYQIGNLDDDNDDDNDINEDDNRGPYDDDISGDDSGDSGGQHDDDDDTNDDGTFKNDSEVNSYKNRYNDKSSIKSNPKFDDYIVDNNDILQLKHQIDSQLNIVHICGNISTNNNDTHHYNTNIYNKLIQPVANFYKSKSI
eukprot:TRINITY_DN16545_c0_g1_i1.p1 TRINITY_DN16545_c0_g1~~TRINITY_DN16545_c0_g1_i1.p1  ORF type:complete len:333 (+),score=75.29 TRINITY_DN16545_c0_g1_i1:13-1011(+)